MSELGQTRVYVLQFLFKERFLSFWGWQMMDQIPVQGWPNFDKKRLLFSRWQWRWFYTQQMDDACSHLRLTQKMCFSSPYFLRTGSRHFSKPSTEVWPAPKRGKPGSWKINGQNSIVNGQKSIVKKKREKWHICMSIWIVRTEDSWQGQWPWPRFFHRVQSKCCKMSFKNTLSRLSFTTITLLYFETETEIECKCLESLSPFYVMKALSA